MSVINRNRRMPSLGSNQILNSIATKQVNKVKPNVNRQPPPDGVIVSPSSYNRYIFLYKINVGSEIILTLNYFILLTTRLLEHNTNILFSFF